MCNETERATVDKRSNLKRPVVSDYLGRSRGFTVTMAVGFLAEVVGLE